jgi:guanidinopropionase
MTSTDLSQMQMPRFAGIPTFMRVPFERDPAALDIALAGVPFDGGVTARPGARFGPREIRNMSTMMRAIHHVTRFNPFEVCRVADIGDVPFDHLYDLEAAHGDIRRFFAPVFRAGKIALTAGGDHSITYPIFQAIAPKKPLALVHIDAHTDTWDAFKGSKFTHGAPFRRAVEAGLLDPTRTIQIGIRGAQNTDEGWRYSLEHGMRVVFMEEFDQLGPATIAEEARRVVGDASVYLSLDVDGLDPVFTPGTGTPEIGGLTTRETLTLLRGLDGLNWVGGDVVEVSPPYDPSGNTALVAATMMYEMLCLFARRHACRTEPASGLPDSNS